LRRAVVFLVIVVIVLFCIAPFTFWDQIQNFISSIQNAARNQDGPQVEPKLEVNVKENSSYWENLANDLPQFISNLDISVTNLGNGPAENVEVTTKIDGANYNTTSIASLQRFEAYTNSIAVKVGYKSAKIVTIEASCPLSSSSKTVIVNANLSRIFDENLCRSFVTPEDQTVVELKNEILKDKPPLTVNWMALRDWVGNNIQYRSDSEIHGESEFWQFPNETIQLRTGDCEDFSLLLCSLLRADGWSPDSVYVIVGEQNNQYHAWVKVIWNGYHYNIEPQGNGFAIIGGDILTLSGYNAKYYFNDKEFGSFE
jgi:predicted transglutaminase-like cysteine proteinase